MGSGVSCSTNKEDNEAQIPASAQGFAAGKASDYGPNTCKEVWITDEISVLVAKFEEKFYGVGSKCPHYGAPLGKGVYKHGRIKCPWHGACFDIKTGDIEDHPGLDCLPTYPCKVKRGEVTVYATPKRMVHKIVRPMVRMKTKLPLIVIFGAGASGFMCAQTLRQEGFMGRIKMLTKDKYLPYDKPKLSKAPGIEWKDIKLRDQSFFDDHDIEIELDCHVGRVDLVAHHIYLESDDNSSYINYDQIVIACGMRPRRYGAGVPGSDLKNILTCGTLEESQEIAKSVGGKNVLIIGSSFVAMELASAIKDKVKTLSILSRQKAPYAKVFGIKTGIALLRYFTAKAKNATFYPVDDVMYFEGNSANEVKAAVTMKKTVISCDLVILAIGALPNTDVFRRDDVKFHSYEGTIVVNKYMETSLKDTYAIGDIANFPIRVGAKAHISVGHWQVAQTHGRIAALNIVGKKVSITDVVPFFWTSLCGINLRYTGSGDGYDESWIYGDTSKMEFCTVYTRHAKMVSILTVGCDPLATQMALAFEEQSSWDTDVPKFVTDRFPKPPVMAESFYGYKRNEDLLCGFDLALTGLKPASIPPRPPSRESESNLIKSIDDYKPTALQTIRDRMEYMRMEQARRKLQAELAEMSFTNKSRNKVTVGYEGIPRLYVPEYQVAKDDAFIHSKTVRSGQAALSGILIPIPDDDEDRTVKKKNKKDKSKKKKKKARFEDDPVKPDPPKHTY